MEENKEKVEVNGLPKPLFNTSWLLFIALIGIGWFLNYELFKVFSIREYLTVNIYLYLGIALVSGYIAAVLVYGLSKLIAGKILGMDVIFASFFGFKFRRIDGKLKFHFNPVIDGIGAEVRMIPHKEENFKWGRYLKSGMFGSLVYAALMIIALSIINTSDRQIAYFLLIMVLFVPFVVTAMQVPYRTDSFGDGFLQKFLKDEKGRKAYFISLQNEINIYCTKECNLIYQEIDENEVNPLVIENYRYNYYYLLDNGNKTELKKTCEQIIRKHKYFINNDLVSLGYVGQFYLMCQEDNFDKTNDYYWQIESSQRHILSSKASLDSIKTSLYVSAYMDVSWEVYSSVIKAYKKNVKSYPFQGRVEKEKVIIDNIIHQIEEKYPEWKDE